ncbi:MAG: GGDEF domain-containing protein, partial [Eubacterium sp.]|nr:GGDEF domain-containing protein [Eubacterium sp.]
AYDMLTEVMNRNEMNNLIDRICTDKWTDSAGVIFMDLNGLKKVNDLEGHLAGDKLLKEAANLLKDVFDVGNIYRAGGDEFTIILQGITEDELGQKVEKIRELSEKHKSVSFAVGSCYVEDKKDIKTALRLADERMYDDKRLYYERINEPKYR